MDYGLLVLVLPNEQKSIQTKTEYSNVLQLKSAPVFDLIENINKASQFEYGLNRVKS